MCAPPRGSSAGNTRGLIEATNGLLPRGFEGATDVFPRGIPAASLKRSGAAYQRSRYADRGVFRGEYPRPH